jgi:hypothetical protein
MLQRESENHRRTAGSRLEKELGRGIDMNALLMGAPNTLR